LVIDPADAPELEETRRAQQDRKHRDRLDGKRAIAAPDRNLEAVQRHGERERDNPATKTRSLRSSSQKRPCRSA
jgi:hypothetical protein